jgi:MerR family transcriptional regulator, thiopeptide resistance regulator
MAQERLFQIKQVGKLARISIRALRHYDDIGLLTPSDRTAAGFRLYSQNDLLRLQQIMLGRSMGQSLEDIKKTLDDPNFDQVLHLQTHKQRLLVQLQSQHAMIASIDAALSQLTNPQETNAMPEESYFDGFDPEQFEAEVKAEWGDTDAYATSQKRAKSRSPADNAAMLAEQSAIWFDAANVMTEGELFTSPAALALVTRHREHVTRWHYPLTRPMHAALADMWEADTRFLDNIDRHAAGLTTWMAAAVRSSLD